MIQLLQNIRRVTRARAEGRRERGAALVEAAIAIPLLLLVIMGSVEFGFAWEAKSASVSAMRSGVLRAATLGDKPQTDMSILQSVIGEIGADKTDQIQWVMIFKADPGMTEDARIANCQATSTDCVMYFGGPGSILEEVATTTNAQAVRDANFDDGRSPTVAGAYQCDPGMLDKNWCAAKRTEGNQDTEFGLAVRFQHEWFTGILPFTPPVFQDSTITSTFLHEGATSITPANNIPTKIGQVFGSEFNTGDIIQNGVPGFIASTGGVTSDTGGVIDVVDIRPGVTALGPFGNETVTLTVETPTPHTEVCVQFQLWVIGSWDKDSGTYGPDTFQMNINGDTSADPGTAEYAPPAFSQDDNNLNDLAFGSHSNEGHVVNVGPICQDHEGSSVSIDFVANLIQGAGWTNNDDEMWAIDGLNVSVKN